MTSALEASSPNTNACPIGVNPLATFPAAIVTERLLPYSELPRIHLLGRWCIRTRGRAGAPKDPGPVLDSPPPSLSQPSLSLSSRHGGRRLLKSHRKRYQEGAFTIGRFTRRFAHGHNRLVECAHHRRTGEEPDHPKRFVPHIAQGVRHHRRDDSHISRGDEALLIPHRSLGLSLEDKQYLFCAVGVGSESVAWLYLKVDPRGVLGTGRCREGGVALHPHSRVVLVACLWQLKLAKSYGVHAAPPSQPAFQTGYNPFHREPY